MRSFIALWRLACVGRLLVAGVLRCAFIFPFITPAKRLWQTGRWCGQVARALGVTIEGEGRSHDGPALLVANHISWLDILAINAVHPARFVSKADVKHWPVLGWLVGCGGTLFIERERKRDALRVVHQIAAALKQGDTVAMFPEGTTGDGSTLLPFHANLLQAAISTDALLQPIALRYADDDGSPSQAVVWVGDSTLAESLWKVATARGLRVRVTQLAPLPSAGQDRRDLASRLRGQIGEALGFEVSALAADH
ncbi:lysophospholipid acyltransferase family protein [Piscinibacter gummiphilus]|uniref:Lysophospholipid acyltransferase family protein n=1 Tax=Piscinibacter gummiphilus TaxID=946333 RepID=A0ABZ0CX26_9BURK|nr:lysophospholipid acyltransferase family protein [Piscinibacter gummiphilus]WOB07423.1 lysophospholipid acyltransferase family protein [Piscinibacter gummiphilus]